MAGFGDIIGGIKSIGGKIAGAFGSRSPSAPAGPQGPPQPIGLDRVGAAAKAVKEREASSPAKQPIGDPQKATGHGDFLHGGEYSTFSSSNVRGASYDPENNFLEIGYKNGGRYGYHDVNRGEAKSFYDAASKGKWVWDHLRLRGTVFGYQKAYTYLGGKSQGYTPKYAMSSRHKELHRGIGPEGRTPLEWREGASPYANQFREHEGPHPMGKADELPGYVVGGKRGKNTQHESPEEIETRPSRNRPSAAEDLASAFKSDDRKVLGKPPPSPAPPPAPAFPPGGGTRSLFSKIGRGISSLFGGQKKAAGGPVEQRLGDGGDNEPAMLTPREYVMPAAQAQKPENAEILEAMRRGETVSKPDEKKSPGIIGKMVGGLKDKYQGLVDRYGKNTAIAIMAAGAAGMALPIPGSAIATMGMATGAAELYKRWQAPKHLDKGGFVSGGRGYGLAPEVKGPIDPGIPLSSPRPQGYDLAPLGADDSKSGSTPPPIGASKLDDAASALKDAAKLLLDVSKASETKADKDAPERNTGSGFDAAGRLSRGSTIDNLLRGGLGYKGGLPGAVAATGGAIGGEGAAGVLGGPAGLAAISGVVAFETSIKSVIGASKLLAGTFLSVVSTAKNPSALLGGVASSVTSQVGAYSPAAVERFQIRLDNLSAALGRGFEPLLTILGDVADQWNELATETAPQIRSIIGELGPPIKDVAKVIGTETVAALRDIAAWAKPFIGDLQQLTPSAGQLVQTFFSLVNAGGSVLDSILKVTEGFLGIEPAKDGFVSEVQEITATLRALALTIETVARGVAESGERLRSIGSGTRNVLESITGTPAVRLLLGGNRSEESKDKEDGILDLFNRSRDLFRLQQQNREREARDLREGGGGHDADDKKRTFAAQPARQADIEVGKEARAAAFGASQWQDKLIEQGEQQTELAQDQLDATQNLATLLREMFTFNYNTVTQSQAVYP